MKVVRKYIDKTHRRVTMEYIMLDSVNDMDSCALELVHLLKGINQTRKKPPFLYMYFEQSISYHDLHNFAM